MAVFKKGKGLYFCIAVSLAVAILIALNFSSFWTDGVFETSALIRCAALFLAMTAALTVEIKLPRWAENVTALALFILGPWITFETVKLIIGVPRYASNIYWLNMLFYAVFQVAVFLLTQSTRVAVCTAIGVGSVLNVANELVLLLRGTPLVPTDLYAISTALKVTETGTWHFNTNMLSGLCCCVLFMAVAAKFRFEYPKKWVRPCAAFVAAVVLTVGCVGIYDIDYEDFSTSTFDTESTNNVNGTALSFYINARKMEFSSPEGYSETELNDFMSQYTDETLEEGEEEELPNIIVIMNESFSDLSYLGRLKTDTPYLKYFNSLTDKYNNGRNLVSVLGGGTCNTEFEFLTGLSMMYMPSNCYAYMQHVKGPVDSMASYLKQFGYQAVAMHPFYEVCWKRNSIYNFMGFDDFVSGEDMAAGEAGLYVSADRWEKGFGDNVEYDRTLISDSFFYKQIIDQFENRTSDHIFIFGVTVQNHSPYEYEGEDFETDVHVLNDAPPLGYPHAEQYLSLIKDSDEALEELITYFEGVDEKTLIVFFGDHQPNVESELVDLLAPDRDMFVNSFMTRFETPYLIWSNYELDEDFKNDYITSANYLGLMTLEAAGVPLSAKYQMMRDAQNVAPAMATWGYFDRFGMWNDRRDRYDSDVLNMYNFYTYKSLNG